MVAGFSNVSASRKGKSGGSKGNRSNIGAKFLPCNFTRSSKRAKSLTCNQVPLANVSSIFKQVNATKWRQFNITFSKSDNNQTIPAELLGNHTAKKIVLKCTGNSLKVDSKAFLKTKNVTRVFSFDSCDLSQFNFDFLTGFDQLATLKFISVPNLHLINWASALPNLRNLSGFVVRSSKDLNQWTKFPNLGNGLTRLVLNDNGMTDATMDRILSWASNTSAKTLNWLSLNENSLTKVSRQISTFTAIKKFSMDKQKTGIPSISNDTFRFSSPIANFSASRNNITTIQPGSFQGFGGI